MLIFKAAAATESDPAIRVLAIPFVLLFVLSAWHAGAVLSGPRGGRWAAVVAAGLMCSPALAADQADGELFAVALVMTSIALVVTAWRLRPSARQFWLACAAGVFAGAAPLVKQNMLEGLLFAALLVLLACRSRRAAGHRELLVGAGALAGSLVPALVLGSWARAAGVELVRVWQELVAFRGTAFDVIWSGSSQASTGRLLRLVVLGLLSGVLPVVGVWLVAVRRRAQRSPETRAVTGLLAFGGLAVVAGGSYWPHYLLQLAPAAVLGAAVVAPLASDVGGWMRASCRLVVGSAVLATAVAPAVYATVPWVSAHEITGQLLAASKARGDTVLVAYGNASILKEADVPSPYPHLWSVPVRTLDPDLARLRATVLGPDAPSWIIEVNSLSSWQIDRDGRLRDAVRQRYRVVGETCGYPVWLRDDLTRQLAPPPRCPRARRLALLPRWLAPPPRCL